MLNQSTELDPEPYGTNLGLSEEIRSMRTVMLLACVTCVLVNGVTILAILEDATI